MKAGGDLNDLYNLLGRTFDEMRDKFKEVMELSISNSMKMSRELISEADTIKEISRAASKGAKLDLIIELPSPYIRSSLKPPGNFNFRIKRKKDDFGVRIGYSGHGGVFFGIGIGSAEPPQAFPTLPNYRNLIRVDWLRYSNGGGIETAEYGPHYHIGKNTKHYEFK